MLLLFLVMIILIVLVLLLLKVLFISFGSDVYSLFITSLINSRKLLDNILFMPSLDIDIIVTNVLSML